MEITHGEAMKWTRGVDCWNTVDERIPSSILIVNLIKRSHTNRKYD